MNKLSLYDVEIHLLRFYLNEKQQQKHGIIASISSEEFHLAFKLDSEEMEAATMLFLGQEPQQLNLYIITDWEIIDPSWFFIVFVWAFEWSPLKPNQETSLERDGFIVVSIVEVPLLGGFAGQAVT